jgi:starvation-inducible DNA-binding protein
MYATKNDLPAKKREGLCEQMNLHLSASLDVMLQTKQAHWNVKGPNFISLHELFDKINEDFEEYSDLLAERIVQLGGYAEGTAVVVAKRTTLKQYPLSLGDGLEHVDYLSTALAHFGKTVREAIKTSGEEFGDADAADIYTEISRGVDKWLWMLEAHLVSKK